VTRIHHRGTPLLALLCLPLVAAGCTFDDSRLQQQACGAGGTCPAGRSCCGGYCVTPGSCPDAAPADGKRLVDGPVPELDRDGDGVPDVTDCAPTNPRFQKTGLEITTFTDPSPFRPIENAADWRVIGGALQQVSTTNVRRAVHGMAAQQDLVANVRLQFAGKGDDGLTEPAGNVALAGVVVRAAGVAAGFGSGYYCAVDMANARLVIGRTSGDDLQKKRMLLLPDAGNPVDPPGRRLGTPVLQALSYQLKMTAEGRKLTCQVVQPNLALVETSVDNAVSGTGQLGLFTVGAAAQFETVKVCVK
jgi:hypothetical protein